MITPSDIAADLAADLRAGTPTRRSIDTRAITGGTSWPATIGRYVEPLSVSGTNFTVAKVSATGTPVAPVAEGQTKPTAGTVTVETVNLTKFAGLVQMHLEQSMSAAGLTGAVYAALAGQALSAFETEAITAIGNGADMGHAYSQSEGFVGGILTAQGRILAAGGNPSLICVAPADVATLGTTMLNADPASGIAGGRVWGGALVHVSHGLTAGNAIVLDPAAVTVAVHEDSPAVILDVYSQAATNTARVVCDLFAAATVTVGSLVVPVMAQVTK